MNVVPEKDRFRADDGGRGREVGEMTVATTEAAVRSRKNVPKQKNESEKTDHKEEKEQLPASYEFRDEDKKEVTDGTIANNNGLFSFLTGNDHQWLLYLTLIAMIVRLAFLNHPGVVVFDEVHFGGFAQKYLNHEFFNDLHPPLARLLVTLSAWFGGFDGKFSFYNIGADYIKPGVPYVTMRAFTATLGALIAPIAYITMRAMNLSKYSALSVGLLIVFENALATQSRLILLDSYLVFFTTLVGLFWVIFQREKQNPFTWKWYAGLLGVGVSMALAASCKWVGLFAVVAVGIFTIADMWQILGNTNISMKKVGCHFAARSVALIVIPFLIYAATFWIHFSLLTEHSASAASFSLEFQQNLKGGELPPTMKQVFYGSHIRIRQHRPDGAFLHSHSHMYPAGSKQQQVTGYHHRDRNNMWIIRSPYVVNKTYVEETPDEESELIALFHRDELRLEHVPTGRFLHSHSVEPPLSNKEKQHEVSCYGHHLSKFSDTNDNWRIEIVDDTGRSVTEYDDEEGTNKSQEKRPILALGTKFRLVHRNLGCKVHSRNKQLPEWGFKQSEITCGRETLRTNQIWIIESNEHPEADPATHENITATRKGFWGRFVELNLKMWDTNKGLSAHHPFGSRPDSWPILRRGIGFWNGNHIPLTEKQHVNKKKLKAKKGKDSDDDTDGEADQEDKSEGEGSTDQEEQAERVRLAQEYVKYKGQQIYLLGNPVVWWISTASVVTYAGLVMLMRMAKRRSLSFASRLENTPLGNQLKFDSFSAFMFVQWLWHYIPFFGMHRQLFLHHYLPAFYFATILFSIILDYGFSSIPLSPEKSKLCRRLLLTGLVSANIYVFWRLSPLGYGLRMTKSQCESIRWLKRWDFDCNSLPDAVSNIATSS